MKDIINKWIEKTVEVKFQLFPNFFRMIEVEGPSLYFLSKRSRNAEKTRACIADLGHHGQEDF